MHPMTFKEFLLADKCENLVEYMDSINEINQIPDIFYNQLEEIVKYWDIILSLFLFASSLELVNNIQKNILQAYESDFAKHTNDSQANKISLIWNSIPSQLARENKKFLYQVVKEGARAREYEDALNWLNDANLIYKIYNVTKNAFPLKAYTDLSAFKIYMNDVGLLRQMAGLDSSIIAEKDRLFEEFKGAFTENYVLNMLCNVFDREINYFTFDRNEIDFLIQNKNRIIPIEVKSNKSTNNRSLTKYNENNDNEISIRFSNNNLCKDGKIINIPLFMIENIEKFI